MDLIVPEKLLILAGILMNVVLIVICLRKLSFRRSMAPVFFTFALVSLLMSGLYWLTYELLRPDARMPFAANEFGESGAFLLMAAALNAVFRGRFSAARREMLCAALFMAGCVVLWIAWSGEWLQDLMSGLCYGYFFCVCARCLKLSGALSRREWRILACLAVLLLGLQGLTFLLPVPWSAAADYGAYAVMFAVLGYGMVKLIRALLRGGDPRSQFALVLSVWAWSVTTMYMSAGLFYLAASLCYVVCLPLIFTALLREEAEA